MIVCATGHRPDKLGGYNQRAFNALADFAQRRIALLAPSGVIVGMAQGWDTAVAVACTRLGLPWTAAIPFEGQESRWDQRAQDDYHKLLLCADSVYTVSNRQQVEDGGIAWAMQERNCWMVDNSQGVFALWNGDRKGGTANCVEYAKSGRRTIINAWPEWEAWWEGGQYLV